MAGGTADSTAALAIADAIDAIADDNAAPESAKGDAEGETVIVEPMEGIRERQRYLAALASQARMYRRRRLAGALTVIGVGVVAWWRRF